MVDIQSPTVEIGRGKKDRKKEDKNHRAKTITKILIQISLLTGVR